MLSIHGEDLARHLRAGKTGGLVDPWHLECLACDTLLSFSILGAWLGHATRCTQFLHLGCLACDILSIPGGLRVTIQRKPLSFSNLGAWLATLPSRVTIQLKPLSFSILGAWLATPARLMFRPISARTSDTA